MSETNRPAFLDSYIGDDGEEYFTLTDYGRAISQRLVEAQRDLAIDMNTGVKVGIPHTHPGWDGLMPSIDQVEAEYWSTQS